MLTKEPAGTLAVQFPDILADQFGLNHQSG